MHHASRVRNVRGYLRKVFGRYGIPHFIDRQRPMKNHPLGELLTALFDIVRHSYSRDSMFLLLKTDLMPLYP